MERRLSPSWNHFPFIYNYAPFISICSPQPSLNNTASSICKKELEKSFRNCKSKASGMINICVIFIFFSLFSSFYFLFVFFFVLVTFYVYSFKKILSRDYPIQDVSTLNFPFSFVWHSSKNQRNPNLYKTYCKYNSYN